MDKKIELKFRCYKFQKDNVCYTWDIFPEFHGKKLGVFIIHK